MTPPHLVLHFPLFLVPGIQAKDVLAVSGVLLVLLTERSVYASVSAMLTVYRFLLLANNAQAINREEHCHSRRYRKVMGHNTTLTVGPASIATLPRCRNITTVLNSNQTLLHILQHARYPCGSHLISLSQVPPEETINETVAHAETLNTQHHAETMRREEQREIFPMFPLFLTDAKMERESQRRTRHHMNMNAFSVSHSGRGGRIRRSTAALLLLLPCHHRS